MTTMATVEQNPNECIGCAACVAIYPEGWEIAEDGKSALIGGKKRKDGTQEKDINDEEKAAHQEAAGCCPTNAIKIRE
jgi:ferredoxin